MLYLLIGNQCILWSIGIIFTRVFLLDVKKEHEK